MGLESYLGVGQLKIKDSVHHAAAGVGTVIKPRGNDAPITIHDVVANCLFMGLWRGRL